MGVGKTEVTIIHERVAWDESVTEAVTRRDDISRDDFRAVGSQDFCLVGWLRESRAGRFAILNFLRDDSGLFWFPPQCERIRQMPMESDLPKRIARGPLRQNPGSSNEFDVAWTFFLFFFERSLRVLPPRPRIFAFPLTPAPPVLPSHSTR